MPDITPILDELGTAYEELKKRVDKVEAVDKAPGLDKEVLDKIQKTMNALEGAKTDGEKINRMEATIKEMEEHIESFGSVLPPSRVMKKCCSVLSHKDELAVTISSVLESRELERLYFSTIAGQGVSVTVLED